MATSFGHCDHHQANVTQNLKRLPDIFLELNYKVIRIFIDRLLSRSNPSDEVLKQYGSRIHDLRKDCVLIFHRAVVEYNVNIVAILSDSLQAAEHTDTLVQLLLGKGDLERTVVHKNVQLYEIPFTSMPVFFNNLIFLPLRYGMPMFLLWRAVSTFKM